MEESQQEGELKPPNRFTEFLKKRVVVAVVSGMTSVALVAAVAVALDPGDPTERQQSLFRVGGSDTTYPVMAKLDSIYNASPGCRTVDTRVSSSGSATQHPHNNTCQLEDIDEDTNPKDGIFDPDTDPLQQSRRANYDHDLWAQQFPLGSSFGIRQLQRQDPGQVGTACGTTATGPNGEAPFSAPCAPMSVARSSRGPGSGEPSASDFTGLRFIGFAREGLSWVCFFNTANSGCSAGTLATSKNLTQDQINRIMKCDPTLDDLANGGNGNGSVDWGDIGGRTGVPIRVFQAQAGSGTRGSWDGFSKVTNPPDRPLLGVPSATSCATPIFENDASQISELAPSELEEAFFYYSSARHLKNPAGTRLGNIGGEAPVLANFVGVRSGPVGNQVEGNPVFPYTRTVYNVIRHADPQGMNANQEVRDYVGEEGFLCKPQTEHTTNPASGLNYRSTLVSALNNEGFAGIPLAQSGGPVGSFQSHCRVLGSTGPAGAEAPAQP